MPYRDRDIEIKPCDAEAFERVKYYIDCFDLDNRGLRPEEFLTAYVGKSLVGFGRIRQYASCYELCSLGVIEPERRKGIGRKLTLHLKMKAGDPLYLVCIIPGFFEALGFSICEHYPAEIRDKLDYCTGSLPVPETYVVMKKNEDLH